MTDRKQNAGNADKPDSEFDRELAMVSRAYRGVDDGTDGPPAAMDDAIRAAARRAVKSGPRATDKSWVSRWSVPLSAAALVVLTTSVGFLALEERPELAPPLPREKLAVREPSPRAAAAAQSARGTPSLEIAQAPTAPPPALVLEKKVFAEERNVVPRDQVAQVQKPMPERNRNEATVVAQNRVLAEESRRKTAANGPAVATATPVAKEATGFVADPLAAGAVAANKDTAAPSATLAKRESVQDGRSLGLQASAGATARADAAPPAQVVKTQAKAAAPALATIASRTATAPPVYAPPAPAAQSAYSAPVPPAKVADKPNEPAEVWIKRILELKKHSKAGEFEEELAKFRKQYPNFKLPDELKTDK